MEPSDYHTRTERLIIRANRLRYHLFEYQSYQKSYQMALTKYGETKLIGHITLEGNRDDEVYTGDLDGAEAYLNRIEKLKAFL